MPHATFGDGYTRSVAVALRRPCAACSFALRYGLSAQPSNECFASSCRDASPKCRIVSIKCTRLRPQYSVLRIQCTELRKGGIGEQSIFNHVRPVGYQWVHTRSDAWPAGCHAGLCQPQHAGNTFLVRSRWGGSSNSELKRIMLDYAFLSVDTVWFHVGEHNLRSRRAVEKLGAQFSHLANESPTGAVRNTVFYRLDKGDWVRRFQN